MAPPFIWSLCCQWLLHDHLRLLKLGSNLAAEAKAMKLPRLWCLDSYDPGQESRNQLFLRTNSVDHQFEYDGPEEQESKCSDSPQGTQSDDG